MKFPNLIHVTREIPEHGPSWLEIRTDGVSGVDTHGQEVAIYQLVSVGVVNIQKSFTEHKRKPISKPRSLKGV